MKRQRSLLVKIVLLIAVFGMVGACNFTSSLLPNEVAATPSPPVLAIPTAVPDNPQTTAVPSPIATTANRPEETAVPPTPGETADDLDSDCVARTDWPTYKVENGDRLIHIAGRVGSTVQELASANCLANPNVLTVGQLLHVPRLPAGDGDGDDQETAPQILSFTADPNPAFGGQQVLLRWQVRHAPHGVILRDASDEPVPGTSGGISYNLTQISAYYSAPTNKETWTMVLYINDGNHMPLKDSDGQPIKATVEIAITEPPQSAEPLEIVSFSATPTSADPGEPVTLNWQTNGASYVELWDYTGYPRGGRILNGNLAADGTYQVTLSPEAVYEMPFALRAYDAEGEWVNEGATVKINCTRPYFFGSDSAAAGFTCPFDEARYEQGAYQPFDNGHMVWFNNVYPHPSSEAHIAVLFADGRVATYADTWNGETFDEGETPPTGYFQPTRGFGKVWTTHEDVRTALGWATAAEQGYTMQIQWPIELVDGWPTRSGIYATLPDGQIIYINNYTKRWRFVE